MLCGRIITRHHTIVGTFLEHARRYISPPSLLICPERKISTQATGQILGILLSLLVRGRNLFSGFPRAFLGVIGGPTACKVHRKNLNPATLPPAECLCSEISLTLGSRRSWRAPPRPAIALGSCPLQPRAETARKQMKRSRTLISATRRMRVEATRQLRGSRMWRKTGASGTEPAREK
jgi:hypothetical protein